MVFPGLIYRTKCHLPTLVTKSVSFLNELKVYNILFSFIHDKLKGMQMLLHTQDLGFSSMRRRVLGVWSRTPFLLAICNLFYQMWNSHLRAGKVPSYECGMSTNHQDIIYENQSSVTAAFQTRNVQAVVRDDIPCLFLMGCLTEPILISEIKETYVDMWREFLQLCRIPISIMQ